MTANKLEGFRVKDLSSKLRRRPILRTLYPTALRRSR